MSLIERDAALEIVTAERESDFPDFRTVRDKIAALPPAEPSPADAAARALADAVVLQDDLALSGEQTYHHEIAAALAKYRALGGGS